MEQYQENIEEPYLNFSKNVTLDYLVNPLIFYHNFSNVNTYDTGKKIIAPQSLLNKISKYDDIEFPIYIKIKDIIFTVYEFVEDIECIYIPTHYFYNLDLIESDIIPITIIKNVPPKATYIKFKVWSKEFYNIPDIKEYLETNLKKLYAVLYKKEYIKLPYFDDFIGMSVTETKPEDIISINEIEELEIDFEPMNEANSKNESIEQSTTTKIENKNIVKFNNQTYYKPNTEHNNNTKNKFKISFKSFDGKGHSLKD
jgi:hypothetical protein